VNDETLVERLDRLAATGHGRRIREAVADRTWRMYRTDLADLDRWTTSHGHPEAVSVPTLMAYFQALAAGGASYATVSRRRSAVTKLLELETAAGVDVGEDPTRHPALVALIRDLRTQAAAPASAEPLTGARLVAVVDAIDTGTLAGVRDRALLLIGFFGALRAGELAALTLDAIRLSSKGVELTAGTDTITVSRRRGDSLDPVAALEAWLDALGDLDNPVDPALGIWRRITRGDRLFEPSRPISEQAINNLINRRAATADLSNADAYTAHSLRAGFLAEAEAQQLDGLDVLRHTRRDHPNAPTPRRPTSWHDDPTRNLVLPKPTQH
jgi:site-specific recombinase XerD